MKADTSATSTNVRPQDIKCTTQIQKIPNPPSILQPDKTKLQITNKCTIPIHSSLSKIATSGYIVPHLKNSSLLSIGKLCDDHCIAMFTKKNLFIFKNNNLILQGNRNNSDGLWDVIFPTLGQQTHINIRHIQSTTSYTPTKQNSI